MIWWGPLCSFLLRNVRLVLSQKLKPEHKKDKYQTPAIIKGHWNSPTNIQFDYWAVSCSIRSITTTGLFSLAPLGPNPLVPSGPFGCLITTILGAPRAASSLFIVFSLEMSRSGLWDVLGSKGLLKYNSLVMSGKSHHSFLTQQAECFRVLWFVTTTNSTSSPTWRISPPSTSDMWKNSFFPSSCS